MYCTNCGERMAEDVKFCTSCGTRKDTTTPPVITQTLLTSDQSSELKLSEITKKSTKDEIKFNLIYFERCIFASLAIGIVVAAMGFEGLKEVGQSPLTVVVLQVLTLILISTLVIFITRKNSKIARWIWLICFAVGLITYIPLLANLLAQGLIGYLSSAQLLLQCIGTYFLFFGEGKLPK